MRCQFAVIVCIEPRQFELDQEIYDGLGSFILATEMRTNPSGRLLSKAGVSPRSVSNVPYTGPLEEFTIKGQTRRGI
jgi:hypothetical protein